MEDRNDHIHDEQVPDGADEPTGQRRAEEPAADAPEEQAAELPAADEPAAVDEPAADRSADAEPGADEAAGEQPPVVGGPEDPRGPQAPAPEAPTQPLGLGAGPGVGVAAGAAGSGAGGADAGAGGPGAGGPSAGGPGGSGGAGGPGGPSGPGAGPTGGGPAATPPPARRLTRARDDRVLGGVCAGLGRYFNTDPVFFRIGAIVLTLIGGAGVLLYLAALLLIPKDDSVATTAVDGSSVDGRNRGLVIAGVVLLLIVAWPFLLGGGLILGGVLVPLAVLVATGVLVWWVVSGEGPSGDAKDIARRAALGIGLLVLCLVVCVGGAWAAAAGGEAIVAALVITAGAAIVAGAFLKPVRWLILPALALALSAGAVSAAGIDLDGGAGERDYRPTSVSDLRDRYELGIGRLTVDLRDTELPPGDTPLELDVGVGSARLIVPDDVCVTTQADLGIGFAGVFDEENDGIDVDFDEQHSAPAGTSRLVVDAEVGVGELLIGESTSQLAMQEADFDGDRDWDGHADRGTNSACEATGAIERG
jgi:phage shock protein PspC (stress-responsive transcriptional regulator)